MEAPGAEGRHGPRYPTGACYVVILSTQVVRLHKGLVGIWKGYYIHKRCRRKTLIILSHGPFCILRLIKVVIKFSDFFLETCLKIC